jgi:antitoxin (DNA-binding transcriptional repressor) of toxin-antitoxin stability system
MALLKEDRPSAEAETVKVGMREFRDHLATYLLEAQKPVAVTRHGETIGLFVPVPRRRTEPEKTALREVAAAARAWLEQIGMTEDEVVEDFKRSRKGGRM